MFNISNFIDNDDTKIISELGAFQVLEYERDLSVSPENAITAYFSSKMNVRRRQLICNLNGNSVIIQGGAMQWTVGDVNATTGVKGVGDFIGKALKGKATGETGVKPEYKGNGVLVLEPTYKHLILLDASYFNNNVVLDDGLFLACDASLNQKVVMRNNISSAVAGGEGLFNLSLVGNGAFCIESDCPKKELVKITLENDVLKIDGSLAIAWSGSLSFTVERSSKSLIGSAISGEGLVNVYRGTGKVLIMPTLSK